MNRSGQLFASAPPLEKNNVKALSKGKRKQTVSIDQGKNPPLDTSPSKEFEEFLWIISKNDYKVVEQLHQTP